MLPRFDIFSSASCSIPLWAQWRANGRPAPRDWASSFSWWGKRGRGRRRGSRTRGRDASRPSRSTRCASPADLGPRASPTACPRAPSSPSRGRSRADPPSGRSVPERSSRPAGHRRARRTRSTQGHGEDVAARLVREPSVEQLADEGDISGMTSVARGSTLGRPKPSSSVSSTYHCAACSASRRSSSAARAAS